MDNEGKQAVAMAILIPALLGSIMFIALSAVYVASCVVWVKLRGQELSWTVRQHRLPLALLGVFCLLAARPVFDWLSS